MADSSESPHAHHEEFSLPLFCFTVAVTLAGLVALLWWLAPDVWAAELIAPIWKGAIAFGVISMVNCFFEYFFHRYVLHTPAVPFLRRLYRQHTLHHALTRIAKRPGRDGTGILFIENKFPIVEPEQGEASFFPWYTLTIFAACLTPVLIGLHLLFPSYPWFLAGFGALGVSLVLYEILHAINHWAFEKWAPLIQHRHWGWFWRPAYAFHLRHHAVTDCNESISGFFGLPVGDWVFRTCIMPKTVYLDGEKWTPGEFASPHPRALIRWLDRWADGVVRRRRGQPSTEAAADVTETAESLSAGSRAYTKGEEIANWVTHGIGLLFSIAALTLLIVSSSLHGDAWHVVSFTVFGLALLALYSISTIYHAKRDGRTKQLFRRLDHAAAFVLIAGTYTPLLLTSLRGPTGWLLLGVIWGLCGAGAVFKLVVGPRHRLVTTFACLFLGWLIVAAINPLLANVPDKGVWLLLAGGLSYSVGVIFRQWQRLRYHHAVWHAFVLGGSTCHFLAVLIFMLPSGA